MGLSYYEYANLTWGLFQTKLEGYHKKEVKELERTRLITYTIYCTATEKDRVSIYDYLPLPSDPSKKERDRAYKKQLMKEFREANRLINSYKKKGFIKDNG